MKCDIGIFARLLRGDELVGTILDGFWIITTLRFVPKRRFKGVGVNCMCWCRSSVQRFYVAIISIKQRNVSEFLTRAGTAVFINRRSCIQRKG